MEAREEGVCQYKKLKNMNARCDWDICGCCNGNALNVHFAATYCGGLKKTSPLGVNDLIDWNFSTETGSWLHAHAALIARCSR